MAKGGPAAMDYVARRPERVIRLAVDGSHACAMVTASPEELELNDAFRH